tara:strand:- start:587 stop:1213 length:627 start_codon:yes stop_codon:yes gene_type:complete
MRAIDNQEKAERAVREFLDLYGHGLTGESLSWVVPRSKASEVHVRLLAAKLANEGQRREYHLEAAIAKLDSLLAGAKSNPVDRMALADLIDMLVQDDIPCPENLLKFTASIYRGEMKLKSPPGRAKHENMGRNSLIHECVLIAGNYVKPDYQDDKNITAVVIVSWCLPDYGLSQDVLGVEGITKIFKDIQRIQDRKIEEDDIGSDSVP